MIKKIKNQNGQSLMELVVAIGVITVGLFSVWNLFISNFNGEQEAGARILSINLAREGLEIVKNIRDSNWLYIDSNADCSYNGVISSPCKWDSGLSGDGTGIIENIFSANVYIDDSSVSSINDSKTRIYRDQSSGLYSHDNSGIPTTYRRLIEIKNICCTDLGADLKCDDLSTDFTVRNTTCLATELKIGLDVKSTVSWVIKGQTRDVTISENIFNWK